MSLSVRRLDAAARPDFYRLHNESCGAGWCNCVAWWVPTWDGWSDRKAEENRALRDALFDRGEYDVYLAYDGDRPMASCQVGLRDRLQKLVRQLDLTPDPDCWAITCFLVAPDARRQGHARALLQGVLDDLRRRGALRVEAYPRPGATLEDANAWTGPEALYRQAGFRALQRGVVSLRLGPTTGQQGLAT